MLLFYFKLLLLFIFLKNGRPGMDVAREVVALLFNGEGREINPEI